MRRSIAIEIDFHSFQVMGCCALPRIDLDDQFRRENKVGSKHVLSDSRKHSSHLQSNGASSLQGSNGLKFQSILVRGDRELFIHSGGHAIKQKSDQSM